ncbi:hypothetical protein ACNVED_16260 (plasmid) [Legionella sp. D16C41]|uniref:hypothetical protein n=1 Tax=Legionella sp. D16C41 TaxID=3402688 RepID=UPI003AF49821
MASYRCARAVVTLANAIIDTKYQVIGHAFKDKNELATISAVETTDAGQPAVA